MLRDLGAAGLLAQTTLAFLGLIFLTGYSMDMRSLLLGMLVFLVTVLGSLTGAGSIASGQAFFLLIAVFATSINQRQLRGAIVSDQFVLLLFGSILLILTLGYLSSSVTMTGRIKILSSATTSAVLSSLIVTLGMYFALLLKRRSVLPYRFVGVAMLILGMIFILGIQSRGGLISAVFFIQLMLFAYRKNSTRKFHFSLKFLFTNAFAFIFFVFFLVYFGENIVARFDPSNQDTSKTFLSGRTHTYLLLVSSLRNLSFIQYMFGNGYGSTFNYIEQLGLEVPHLDMLVYLFDGGFVGLILYLLLLFRMGKFGLPYFVSLFFFLNGLHTNMHLWPNLIPATIVLSVYLEMKRKRLHEFSLARWKHRLGKSADQINHRPS